MGIKYKEEFPHPKFTKKLEEANKYELCVTMRLIDNVPNPSCNWNKSELIKILSEKNIVKAIDLGGITDAKKLDKLSRFP